MVRPLRQLDPRQVDWPALAPHQPSVAALVARRLERLIEDRELADGSRLPPERELAEMLGVSRSSIREAVRELWLKGLVDRRQGQGTYVTSSESGHDAFLRHVHGRLGEPELTIINVLDYRAALEPAIAARAAERARAADVSRLQNLLSQMEAEPSPAKCSELDAAFHHTIAQATANPLLIEVVGFSATWLDETRRETLQSKRRRAMSVASHRVVLEAIAAHDPLAASRAMAQHIEEVTSFVDQRLAQRRRKQANG